jgi:hypothetical protein
MSTGNSSHDKAIVDAQEKYGLAAGKEMAAKLGYDENLNKISSGNSGTTSSGNSRTTSSIPTGYENYAKDKAAGYAEIANAQAIYQQAIKTGNIALANQAHEHANAIRQAMGVADQYDPNTGALLNPGAGATVQPVVPQPQVVQQPQQVLQPNNPFNMYQTTAQMPTWYGANSGLLNGYINFDYDKILKIFQEATEAEFKTKEAEYKKAETQFYDQLFGTQATALDTIRKSRSAALANGASTGVQAANELLSMMGLSQEAVASNTELTQTREALADKKAAALAAASVNALNTANGAGAQAANIAANLYAADTQMGVGQLDAMARIQTAIMQKIAAMYGADQQLAGQQAIADANRDAANTQAGATVAASKNNSNNNPITNKTAAELVKAGDYVNWLAYFAVPGGYHSDSEQRKYWLQSGGNPSVIGMKEVAKGSKEALYEIGNKWYGYIDSNNDGSGGGTTSLVKVTGAMELNTLKGNIPNPTVGQLYMGGNYKYQNDGWYRVVK